MDELDRLVHVRSRTGQGPVRFGTGYLIAPRLVLSARHIVDSGDPLGVVKVSRAAEGSDARRFAAQVVWPAPDSRALWDAALLEVGPDPCWQVPASLQDLTTRPPQRFGQLIGTRPHPVTVSGYPRMQTDGATRLPEQLEATVRPGTGSTDHYEIFSTDPLLSGPDPTVTSRTTTRWSGMSGAALLCEGLLIGVVRRDRQAVGGTRLTAVRIRDLVADATFRDLVYQHTGWPPVLEPVEPSALVAPASAARDLRAPTMLLRADAEGVEFHDREAELRRLRRWCLDASERFAITVLTGPGGHGKTRLARQLTAEMRESGWVGAHLRAGLDDNTALPDLSCLDTDLPLLLVVDYAEALPRQIRRLVEHLRTSRHRTRLLLVARTDGPWRSESLGATDAAETLLAGAPVVELGPLVPVRDPEARNWAFASAVRGLSRFLGQVPALGHTDWTALASQVQPPDSLTDPRYDSVLTLQMTALATLLQQGSQPVEAEPGEPAETTLLRHEMRYWQGTAASQLFQLRLRPAALARAVAAAALCGAADETEAQATVGRVPGLPPSVAHLDVAEWLRALYPVEPGRYWGSLQPDRLAEYLASTQLTTPDNHLPALLAAASPAQQNQAVTVLARAAVAHANAHRGAHAAGAVKALEAALDATAPDATVLRAAIAALPHPSPTLAPLSLRLSRELVDATRDRARSDPVTHEPDLASALSWFAVNCTESGLIPEAVTAGEEAVALLSQLARANPEGYEVALAWALSNICNRLAMVGRREEGLVAAEEAIALFRRRDLKVGLARSLPNLGIRLAAMGRRAEAVSAAEEAVSTARILAETDPDAYGTDLARALTSLATQLGQIGRTAEACDRAAESVTLYRRLVSLNADAHERDLARALNALAWWLGMESRTAEGLPAAREAVAIYRRLVKLNADGQAVELAGTLDTVAWLWTKSGQVPQGRALTGKERQQGAEALRAATEAVEIITRFAAQLPNAYGTQLHALRSTLATVLELLGRDDEAQEARRPLPSDHLTEL